MEAATDIINLVHRILEFGGHIDCFDKYTHLVDKSISIVTEIILGERDAEEISLREGIKLAQNYQN